MKNIVTFEKFEVGEEITIQDNTELKGVIVSIPVEIEDQYLYVVKLDKGRWVEHNLSYIRFVVVHPDSIKKISDKA